MISVSQMTPQLAPQFCFIHLVHDTVMYCIYFSFLKKVLEINWNITFLILLNPITLPHFVSFFGSFFATKWMRTAVHVQGSDRVYGHDSGVTSRNCRGSQRAKLFREYKPSRALRSKDSGQLVQSRVQTKHGEAAFSCYAANKWNKLPVELKLSPNVDFLKSRLKTFLFSCVYAWNLQDIFSFI